MLMLFTSTVCKESLRSFEIKISELESDIVFYSCAGVFCLGIDRMFVLCYVFN